jgi:glycosyltransferase involved in cell wall biosynthesis
MNRKTIHLIQSLDNGGCENMLLRTLPLLSDFEHIIITLKKEGELSPKFKENNIQVINLDQKSLLNLSSYKRLLNIIKKIHPDIIITYLFHADVIGRLFIQKRTNLKVIPFLRTTYNHKKYWIPRLFEKLTYKQVPHYLANSESVKEFITKIGADKNNVTVIPNGIDTGFYDKIPRDEKLRKSFGIKKEDLNIICVANLHINKGHKYLFEAFENIYKENKNINLLIVGDGDEKENLLKQIENYQSKNNILFLGKRNDVPRLLKISDIFVLPTLFEGMSNAIMEAMASGLPIITTNIPENKELIENKKTGFLIPVKNSEKIADKIIYLLENQNKRENIGKKAKNQIAENFETKKVIKKLTTFYNSI